MNESEIPSDPNPDPAESVDPGAGEILAKVGCRSAPGETVILELPSSFVPLTPQAFFGGGEAHTCSVVLTNQRLIFHDHDEKDIQFSFELSRTDLDQSKLGRSGTTVTIESADGPSRVIQLSKGDVDQFFDALGRELPASTGGRDALRLLLIVCLPVAWFVGGVLLARVLPTYTIAIAGVMVAVPMFLFGFFFGRAGTILVLIGNLFLGAWNAVEGSYPLWVSGVTLLAMVGLSILGQLLRSAVRGAASESGGQSD